MQKAVLFSLLWHILPASAWIPLTPRLLVDDRHHHLRITTSTRALTAANFIATDDVGMQYPYENVSRRCAPLFLYRKVVEGAMLMCRVPHVMSLNCK